MKDPCSSIRRWLMLVMLIVCPRVGICQDSTAADAVTGSAQAPATEKTDSETNIDPDDRPSLASIMARFAEHESRYLPFHIKYRESLRMEPGISDEVRKRYTWGDGRRHERDFDVAQAEPLKWMSTESLIVDSETEAVSRRVCDSRGIHHSGVELTPHGKHPQRFISARPLLGVFPLRMTSPSHGVLLSEYYREDASRLELTWDGSRAILAFTFGADEKPRSRYKLWLSGDYDWHPVRMERYLNVTDADFYEEWEATTFYHATNGRQVRSGRVRYRDDLGVQADNNNSDSKATLPPGDAVRPVGSIEQRRPIAYSVDFVVENTSYGTPLDEKIFATGPIAADENAIDKTALVGCELHVVGMYMPKEHSQDDRVYVDVKPSGKPMVLALTGYFGAQWNLSIDPKADVRQIVVAGYYEHEIAEPLPDAPIRFLTYFPKADKNNKNYFWAYAWHTTEGRNLQKRLKNLTGLSVATFQGEYAAKRFVVDGVRGRNLVEDTKAADSAEDKTGLFSEIVGSLFGEENAATARRAAAPATTTPGAMPAAATPAIATTMNSVDEYLRMAIVKAELELKKVPKTLGDQHPVVVELRETLKLLHAKQHELQVRAISTPEPAFAADRASLESARKASETQYRLAEESCLQAAREYRAEATQESRDPKAMAALKVKVDATVKAAFQAQSSLQQIRLQIAELDLAELKSKHHQRKALSEKIIARRVADLMNGEDLDWPKSASSLAPSETVGEIRDVKASADGASENVKTTPPPDNLENWMMDIRAIGPDNTAKREAALNQIEAALKSDDMARNLLATKALAQTGDVKYEKAKYRERSLELCRSSNIELATSALYALYNTERKDGDLALAQEVLAQPSAAKPGHSISHLLMMFGNGVIDGKSEEIVLMLLNSPDAGVRREALRGLWGAKTSDRLMTVVIELVGNTASHHDAIYYALSTCPDKSDAVVDKLIEVLSDPDRNNWDRALWGLSFGVRASQHSKIAAAMLQMYENRSDPRTRAKCVSLIQQYGTEEQKTKLQAMTK